MRGHLHILKILLVFDHRLDLRVVRTEGVRQVRRIIVIQEGD